MKTPALLLACVIPGFVFTNKPSKSIPVASFRNTPELMGTVGTRVVAILKEREISCVLVGSLGTTVSVSENHAQEALRLLAKAIQLEKLKLSLLARKGDRYEIIPPESVLRLSLEKWIPACER